MYIRLKDNIILGCQVYPTNIEFVPYFIRQKIYFSEWPRIELQHLDISMSNLEVISESALDGLRLQTLVLVANRFHYIESQAFR